MYTKRNDKGIIDYLVNKLYSIEDYKLDFYIPELRFTQAIDITFHLAIWP